MADLLSSPTVTQGGGESGLTHQHDQLEGVLVDTDRRLVLLHHAGTQKSPGGEVLSLR
jgi:hypothetical protein